MLIYNLDALANILAVNRNMVDTALSALGIEQETSAHKLYMRLSFVSPEMCLARPHIVFKLLVAFLVANGSIPAIESYPAISTLKYTINNNSMPPVFNIGEDPLVALDIHNYIVHMGMMTGQEIILDPILCTISISKNSDYTTIYYFMNALGIYTDSAEYAHPQFNQEIKGKIPAHFYMNGINKSFISVFYTSLGCQIAYNRDHYQIKVPTVSSFISTHLVDEYWGLCSHAIKPTPLTLSMADSEKYALYKRIFIPILDSYHCMPVTPVAIVFKNLEGYIAVNLEQNLFLRHSNIADLYKVSQQFGGCSYSISHLYGPGTVETPHLELFLPKTCAYGPQEILISLTQPIIHKCVWLIKNDIMLGERLIGRAQIYKEGIYLRLPLSLLLAAESQARLLAKAIVEYSLILPPKYQVAQLIGLCLSRNIGLINIYNVCWLNQCMVVNFIIDVASKQDFCSILEYENIKIR
jgi:hypothetical protein